MRLKFIVLIGVGFIIINCKNPNNTTEEKDPYSSWTEEQKREYYFEKIGEYHDVERKKFHREFMKKMYPDLKARNIFRANVYALDESYVDTVHIDSNKCWIRILVEPLSYGTYCLIIEKKFGRTIITAKITDGDGWSFGLLKHQISYYYSDTLYDEFSTELKAIGFWKINDNEKYPWVSDGDTWTFEALENGKYKYLKIDCPDFSEDSTVYKLWQYGVKLRDKSNLMYYFKSRYGNDTRYIDCRMPEH